MHASTQYASAILLLMSMSGCAGLQGHDLSGTNQEMVERAALIERDRNATLQAHCHAVQMALEMHAVDHEGLFPSQETLLRDLTANNYLDDGHFPANPWSDTGAWQTNVIDPGPLSVRTTAADKGTVLGPGQMPDGKAFGLTTYGAIVYAVDSTRKLYHLYAIGREGNQAVVKLHATNE